MLRSVAIARIQRGLGFRSDQSDNIILQLQESQRLLEKGRSLPRFLLQEDATLTVASGTGQTAFPTGFLREKDGELLRYYDTDDEEYVFLEKLTKDESLSRFVNVDAGAPIAYAVRKAGIDVFPERDTSYDLTWSYYKSADALTSDIENAWLANAPEVLIGHAGAAMAKDLRDAEAVGIFQSMYSEAWRNMFADDVLLEETGDPIYVGGRL